MKTQLCLGDGLLVEKFKGKKGERRHCLLVRWSEEHACLRLCAGSEYHRTSPTDLVLLGRSYYVLLRSI